MTLCTSNAIEIHTFGLPCTKFIVPSIGSIIHVGADVNSILAPPAVDSSPMNLKDVNNINLVITYVVTICVKFHFTVIIKYIRSLTFPSSTE